MSTAADGPALVPVAGGALALFHRPKRNAFSAWRASGITHVVTLLGEREGARELGAAAEHAGLGWVWIPMAGAAVPDDAATRTLLPSIDDVSGIIRRGGRVVVHCSAGIHRTGMLGYALLRRLGLDAEAARGKLLELRAVTAEGVGADRLAWGDTVAGLEPPGT